MTSLVAYRSSVVTPDTAEALRGLEQAGAALGGVRIRYEGVPSAEASWKGVEANPGPTGLPANLSMRPTGREVYLSLKAEKKLSPNQELALLWGIAIPLGFIPWTRYPLSGPGDTVFHYFGPWRTLVDFLHGEGHGEYAWPSLCAAAQSDVGRWAGQKPTEIAVQSHLHRLGIQCGLVDGEIGERTLSSLRSLGLGGLPLSDVLLALEGMKNPPSSGKPSSRSTGYFTMNGAKIEAFTSGAVQVGKTRTGFAVTSEGPGRLIFLIGDSDARSS